MKIGLDLSVVQTPHRMRGIGSVAINVFNNLPEGIITENSFVIFLYEKNIEEAREILNLDKFKGNYEIRILSQEKRVSLPLPGKLRRLNGLLNNMNDILHTYQGDARIKDLRDVDLYLQFDQMQAVPRSRKTKTAVILYDLIPYIMEADYLWSYRTARGFGDSRKSSLRKAFHRKLYKLKATRVAKTANKLIAISDHTKQDYIDYLGVHPSKIQVAHLGIDNKNNEKQHRLIQPPQFERYLVNSWGYMKRRVDLTKKPYLLYVGGADPRRKLQDLVAAFNNLKAQGNDIQLVLAGDTMKGAKAIPTLPIQESLISSSYKEDIVYLGFVSNDQREWLYENALVFVYPSVYEGFGLPILEAMQYGTPVITYSNSSIKEIAGKAALYARDSLTIEQAIKNILEKPSLREELSEAGKSQAAIFSWHKTATKILDLVKM